MYKKSLSTEVDNNFANEMAHVVLDESETKIHQIVCL